MCVAEDRMRGGNTMRFVLVLRASIVGDVVTSAAYPRFCDEIISWENFGLIWS
jgi:hypothetical protein